VLIYWQNTLPNFDFRRRSQYENDFSGYQGNIGQETRPMIQKYSCELSVNKRTYPVLQKYAISTLILTLSAKKPIPANIYLFSNVRRTYIITV
jgi:hypothetical protein